MSRPSASSEAPTPPLDTLPDEWSIDRPKGEQLQELLEGYISSLEPGSLLPSERAMAEHFGVARMTVRNELERLAAKGLIYRLQGRGTFVAEAKLTQSEMLRSFSEDMRERGLSPGSRVLSCQIITATPLVASNLEIPPDSEVVGIERVRTADGEPVAFERAFLPSERFKGLEEKSLENRSLYELLKRTYRVSVHRAQQRISAVTLDREEAALLHAPEGQPAFLIQRVTRDEPGKVIEYVRSIYRGDRYELSIRLHR